VIPQSESDSFQPSAASQRLKADAKIEFSTRGLSLGRDFLTFFTRMIERMSEPNIRMRRPTLEHLPTLPALPAGYELHQFIGQESASALAKLLTAAFEEPWDETRVKIELTEAPDVHAVYVVTYESEMVATASSQLRAEHTTSGYVHWVGTHPEYRGKGLAYILVARVLQDFVERGYTSAYLITQPFRHAAIKTYLKLGFTPEYEVEGENQQTIWSGVFQAMFKK
jgi:mycothiol synthase